MIRRIFCRCTNTAQVSRWSGVGWVCESCGSHNFSHDENGERVPRQPIPTYPGGGNWVPARPERTAAGYVKYYPEPEEPEGER